MNLIHVYSCLNMSVMYGLLRCLSGDLSTFLVAEFSKKCNLSLFLPLSVSIYIGRERLQRERERGLVISLVTWLLILPRVSDTIRNSFRLERWIDIIGNTFINLKVNRYLSKQKFSQKIFTLIKETSSFSPSKLQFRCSYV